jgi:hypothetical protein
MPEADETSPGHVGHTPQPVAEMLSSARARAIDSSPAAMTLPDVYAGQTFPQLVVHPQRESTLQTLLALERWRQRGDDRQPWPLVYREGLAPGGATLGR